MDDVLIRNVGALIASKSRWSSSSDSSEDELLIILTARRERLKIINYVHNIALNYDDIDFRSHFRLNKIAVEELCQELNFERNITLPGRPPLRPLDSLLLTLWVLANQESFRGIADRFGLSKGHCHQVFIKICKKICLLRRRYIVWPTTAEDFEVCVHNFNSLRENAFPNVIGCIDGTHISIKGNRRDNSFYNRKGYTSMIIQGICNSKLEFIDIYCGWPGSSHDSRVFTNSPVYNKMDAEGIIPAGYHLLGDSAYPLKTYLMVPFKDNGHLTNRQKKYNRTLSSSRVVIENAFGRLKGVFRRLKYLDLGNYEYFKFIVIAASVLHNYILKNNIPVDYDHPEIDENPDDLNQAYDGTELARARQKRNLIMNSFT